ncbi:hypothetical protein DY000_02015547 [Brassica cretica]|uniref:Uncharacterized protein n=1 Tax=Brassica cretica TaxID=69181 RepID=A0ABQ7CN64_BRACR|nr:hypothetical protein DY000_02015547 [Brassica cretica]
MNQEEMNFMRVSHMRNFSTCKDVMKQINTKQKPVGKEHVSVILTRESTTRRSTTNIHHRSTSVRNHHPLNPDGYAREIDGHALQVSSKDIADLLQMANGAENLFMQQRNSLAHQQRVKCEIYNTTGGVDDRFKQKSRQHTRPSIDVEVSSSIDVEVSSSIDVEVSSSIDRHPEFGKRAYDRDGTRRFNWEEKDEYGVYRDDHGHARDVDGHIISVSKGDIKSLLERASRDEHIYLCLPEHASSFTKTKLVPEIYTKDEINEMFYGVCGAQEKNEGDEARHSQDPDTVCGQSNCCSVDRQTPANIDRRQPITLTSDGVSTRFLHQSRH